MEKIICKKLIIALEKSKRISDNQFGFCANCCTVTLLLSAVHDWSSCLEHHSITHCVFLDFAKTFDSLPHEHLLLKLQSLGITAVVEKLEMTSFFSNLSIPTSSHQ